MSLPTIGFGDPKKGASGKGKKAVEKYFSPEFRNRLDSVISFNGLDLQIMEMIVDKFMAEFAIQLAAKKVEIAYTDATRAWMAGKGFDPRYGARPLARVLQTEIKDVLADEILFGRLSKNGKVIIDVKDDQLVFDYQ
jgi:ATP-dependent Clp protease ATP-binding subunit ClpA